MKRRRIGAAYTTSDNLLARWSGSMKWCETDKDWDSFVCFAEDVCKRAMKNDRKGDNERHMMKMMKEINTKRKRQVEEPAYLS